MGVERKLLWWKYVENEIPQLFGLNFLIINEPREIKIINDRICYALEIVEERKKIDEGILWNSGGLHYSLFTLCSPTSKIDFNVVYGGLVKKDRVLQKRETKEGWNYFIEKIIGGEI